MSRGPRLSQQVKRMIAREALTQLERPRMDLAAELQSRLQEMGIRAVPEQETIAKLISSVRQRAPRNEDTWSLGASLLHNIPAEANQDLFKILRWGLIVDRPFTVREAKWVARLRGVVPFAELLHTAAWYAVEEQIAESLGETIDTAFIDASLCFKGVSPLKMKVHEEALKDGIAPYRSSAMDKQQERSLVQAIGPPAFMDESASSAVEFSLGVCPEHSQTLSEDADTLYALWLRRLAKAPKWKSLPKERREGLVEQLHQEVAFVSQKAESDSIPEADRLGEILFWEPSKALLELVGIPTGSRVQKEGKEKADERSHSQEVQE